MLGPLVNPAEPKQQLVGVFNLKLARLYQYLHENLHKNYTIVHSIDGYDEVSLTGPVKLIKSHEELLVTPAYFNMRKLNPSEIYGGDTVESAAEIFKKVIKGEGTQSQTDTVVANSALAIQCFDFEKPIEECIAEAVESIASGNAYRSLTTLIATK